MLKFLLKRIFGAIPVLFIIATITFFMVRLVPGGPFDRERPLSEDALNALNAYYGFDKPVYVQYVQFLKNLAHGELGPSYKYEGWSVNELIAEKASVSLQLGLYALLIALAFGVAIGVVCAAFKNTRTDKILSAISLLGICLPSFVVAPVLILMFALKIKIFPAIGFSGFSGAVLPSVSLALFYCAWIARLCRSQCAEIAEKAYIKTARAKGVGPFRIYFVHVLKNAAIPLVSYIGPAAAGLLTGSFIIESIFQISGLGRFFISSALDSDYTMIMGCVLVYAFFIVVFNILSDIILALLNPKIASNLGLGR